MFVAVAFGGSFIPAGVGAPSRCPGTFVGIARSRLIVEPMRDAESHFAIIGVLAMRVEQDKLSRCAGRPKKRPSRFARTWHRCCVLNRFPRSVKSQRVDRVLDRRVDSFLFFRLFFLFSSSSSFVRSFSRFSHTIDGGRVRRQPRLLRGSLSGRYVTGRACLSLRRKLSPVFNINGR